MALHLLSFRPQLILGDLDYEVCVTCTSPVLAADDFSGFFSDAPPFFPGLKISSSGALGSLQGLSALIRGRNTEPEPCTCSSSEAHVLGASESFCHLVQRQFGGWGTQT